MSGYQEQDRHERKMIDLENQMVDLHASGQIREPIRYLCESCGRECDGQYCCEPCQHHAMMTWLAGEMLRTIRLKRNDEFIHLKLREVAKRWEEYFVSAGGSLDDVDGDDK